MRCPNCNTELKRLDETVSGRCKLCGKDCESDCDCEKGHLICGDCTEDLIRERIKEICRTTELKNPYDVLEEFYKDGIIATRFLKNHICVGAALAAAYNNASGKKLDIDAAVDEIMRRGALIPPKACGHGGDCGAAVACGIFYSTITDTHPLTPGEQWGDVAILTGSCLVDLGKIGGPRCCNRGTLVSMKNTVAQVKEKLGVEMEWYDRKCIHKNWNKQCKGESCPFF